MEVVWRAFPLHPETPDEGRLLADLFANQPVNIDQVMARLKQKAAELELPFGDRQKTYNSRLAQELGLWAASKGQGDAFHMAAFKAYFVEGKNLAQNDVLLDLADTAGLASNEAAKVLANRTFRDAVDADWARSRKIGVTAVPTFLINQERLVGAQPYGMLERLVINNGIKKNQQDASVDA